MITTIFNNLRKLFTDPSSGELSASRFNLSTITWVGEWLCIIFSALMVYMVATANTQHLSAMLLAVGGIVTGLATTNAGVYFASTRKEYRRGACNEGNAEGPDKQS